MLGLNALSLTGRRAAGDVAPVALLSLNYVSGTLDSTTLTRSSSATYFNSAGTLTSAETDVARFDYNSATLSAVGLLVEPSRTNLKAWSQTFIPHWNPTIASISEPNVTGPDGVTNSAVTFTMTSGADVHQIYATEAGSATTSFSIFAKAGTARYLTLAFGNGGGDYVSVNFDLQTGVVAQALSNGNHTMTTYHMTACPNGWYRCVIDGIVRTNTTYSIICGAASATFTPDGYGRHIYTAAGTETYFLYGVQIEEGATATSYIYTTGSAVTRSADVATITIPSGVGTIRYTFDNDTTQDVSVTAGSYTIPTNLNRSRIKTIVSI